MRLNVMRFLVLLDAALMLVLLALWLAPEGTLRNTGWFPPAALVPELAGMLPRAAHSGALPAPAPVTLVDKPLFSPDRRPPPPPVLKAAAPAAAPPDPLANIRLLGIFKAGASGGIIASIDGKPQRVLLQQTVGPWTVQSIDGRDVTFVRGSESRVLRLLRPAEAAAQAAAAKDAALGDAGTRAGAPTTSAAARPAPAAAASQAAAPVPMTPAQREAYNRSADFGLIKGAP